MKCNVDDSCVSMSVALPESSQPTRTHVLVSEEEGKLLIFQSKQFPHLSFQQFVGITVHVLAIVFLNVYYFQDP